MTWSTCCKGVSFVSKIGQSGATSKGDPSSSDNISHGCYMIETKKEKLLDFQVLYGTIVYIIPDGVKHNIKETKRTGSITV